MRAEHLIEQLIEPNTSYDQVTEIVDSIKNKLIPGLNVMVAGSRDPECGNRSGYVRGLRPPVVLCPNFFGGSGGADPESQIRTILHEAVHLSGIGSGAAGESYCVFFDCQTNCGGFRSADAWAHFIHCLSGQVADAITP